MIFNQPDILKEAASKAPVSDEVRAAFEFFESTGVYRTEDLRRLLGDPRETVQAGPGLLPPWAKPKEKK